MVSTVTPAARSAPKCARKRNRRKQAGICLALLAFFMGLAVVFAFGYAWTSWSGRRAWKEARDALSARNEPISFDKLIPRELAEEQNLFADPAFAEIADVQEAQTKNGVHLEPKQPKGKRALDRFEILLADRAGNSVLDVAELGSMPDRRLSDWKKTAAFFRKAGAIPPGTELLAEADETLAGLSKAESAFAQIETLARRLGSRFPVDYSRRPALPMPHYDYLVRLARFFQLRAAARMAVAKSDAARHDLFVVARLADSVVTEPLLYAQLVRCALLDDAVDLVWEGIERKAWNDSQLAEIERRLSAIALMSDFGFALRGERALVNDFVESRKKRPKASQDVLSNPFYPDGLLYSDLARVNLSVQELIDIAEAARSAGIDQTSVQRLADSGRHISIQRPVSSMTVPALAQSMDRFVTTQTRIDQARIACAIERFRLREGRCPNALAEIEPGFLKPVPSDLHTGRPMEYRTEGQSDYVMGGHGTPEWQKSPK